jgi:ACS family hexuronate transporter-like MFS transporter
VSRTQDGITESTTGSAASAPPSNGDRADRNVEPLGYAAEIKPPPWYRSYRWLICGLLFLATTLNYTDRAVFGVLGQTLRDKFGWSATQFGDINAYFTLAYAIGFLFVGWFIDRVGTRYGYAICLVVWSLAAMSHSLARGFWSFAAARFALGIGESGNFPAAIKTTAEWFPKKQRAAATGIFNAGSNVGAILAPAIVPMVALRFGWQYAFLITFAGGIIWIVLWVTFYRKPTEHPKISREELDYIQSDPSDPPVRVPYLKLLQFRQTWAFAVGKFMTDSVWWFYLFWFPVVMADRFKVDLKSIGLPMIIVYVLADFGSIAGGALSSWMLGKGWSTNVARKTAMFICALCIVPVVMAPITNSEWLAVWLVGVAAAAHQGFSANLFTLTSDMFPRKAVSSVVGIGGFFGAMGGYFLNMGAGRIRDMFGSYIIVFVIAGAAYLVALLFIHLLVPRLEPVELGETGRGFPVGDVANRGEISN